MACGQTSPRHFYAGGPYTGNPNASKAVGPRKGGCSGNVELQAGIESDVPTASKHFGSATIIRGDRMLVGERLAQGSIFPVGEVHLFTKVGGTWTRQDGVLSTVEVNNGYFGNELAGNSDLSVWVAGEPQQSSGNAIFGSRTGTTLSSDTKIQGNVANNLSDLFGAGLGMSSDGLHCLIGAPGYDTDGGTKLGAGIVEYWEDVGGTWTYRSSFTSGTGTTASAGFGCGIAMINNNEAWIMHNNAAPTSEVQRFTRSGTTWTYQDNFTLNYGQSDFPNTKCPMDTNGGALIFGCYLSDAVSNNEGTVIVTDTSGTELAEIAGDELENEFGSGVSITADKIAAIGQHRGDEPDGPILQAGLAHVWEVCY